jgi:hypothetical protein
MTEDVTEHPLFDGTFSLDAVASAAHAIVARLHDEAMATIATLADTWESPDRDTAAPATAEADEPVVYRDPATWSAADDEDDLYDEDEEVRVLPLADLSALLRPRPAAGNVTARVDQAAVAGAEALARAATDEFAAPDHRERQFVSS